MESSNIKYTVMRRVFYSYALSIASLTVFWQGVFLGAAAILLARWLHVASIIKNFLSVPVGSVPQYIYSSFLSAITHGEILTAITLILSGAVAVSAGYHLMQVLMPRMLIVRHT